MRRSMVLAASLAVVLVGVSAASPGPQTQAATQGRWVIRDLGTLGGEESDAVAINDRAQIVGHAGDYDRRILVWQNGKMRVLGTLGGPQLASDINNKGQVVGWVETKPFVEHAFLWQNGKMRDLGTLGGPQSWAWDINDHGQVVGYSDWGKDKYGDPITHAFLWQNGKMRDLGTLGGPASSALEINERGQVVGHAETKKKTKEGSYDQHAFLWQNGKMRDLGTLGGRLSSAEHINDKGQVVGYANTKQHKHAFLWQNGTMRDLGTLGGDESDAVDINDRGQVVGRADTRAKGKENGLPYTIEHAFLWENGEMRDLGTLGLDSHPEAINERGQVVGAADTKAKRPCVFQPGSLESQRHLPMAKGRVCPVYHAFVWQEGKMRDLGTLGLDSHSYDINERGEAVGSADTKSGSSRAVLWTYKP